MKYSLTTKNNFVLISYSVFTYSGLWTNQSNLNSYSIIPIQGGLVHRRWEWDGKTWGMILLSLSQKSDCLSIVLADHTYFEYKRPNIS